MVDSFQKPKLDNLLRRSRTSETALADVCTLYSLLPRPPGVTASVTPEGFSVSGDTDSDITNIRKKILLTSILKKYPGFSGEDPRGVAKGKFLRYEEHCKASNETIRSLRSGRNSHYLQSILLMAQSKIARVLGKFRLEDLLRTSRWGPGTTSSCKGPRTDTASKFKSRPDITKEFLARGRLLMPLLPSWSAMLADSEYGVLVNPCTYLVRGNQVTFVPKTSDCHRAIAVEPHINSFFQAGLGRMIRERMLRFNVDLNDQTLNQRLARLGSIDNSLATIDLEGASDTICTELVRDLLPEDWFDWMDQSRSHYGKLDGVEIRYQKFSSMGNGFTFDLESLIFWALSSAVTEQEGYNSYWVNVFGDDIIVPSGVFDKVTEVLTSVGFIVNSKKSFSDGPFRESCGKDYWLGSEVRPIYLKRHMTTDHEWLRAANAIRLLAHRWANYSGCDRSLKTAYDFCISRVDPRLRRFRVPGYHVNDIFSYTETAGLISNFDEATPKQAVGGWDGYNIPGLIAKAIVRQDVSRSLLVSGVFTPAHGRGNRIPLREQVCYREGTLFVPFPWYDLGPWV